MHNALVMQSLLEGEKERSKINELLFWAVSLLKRPKLMFSVTK